MREWSQNEQAEERGRKAERAKIVAWLRRCSEAIEEHQGVRAAETILAVRNAASCIENGDHAKYEPLKG